MRHRNAVRITAVFALALLAGCAKNTTTAPAPNATVSGVVLHLDGSAYHGALVDAQTLLPVNGALEIATVASDSLGGFLFSGLRAAEYTISVIEDDSLAVADTVTAPATGVSLQLQPGVVIRGVVLRPDTTLDRNGIIVTTDLPTALALTDTSGFFELRGVAPGLRQLIADDPIGSTALTRAVNAIAGDTLDLGTLRLTPAPIPVIARMRLDAARRRPGATRR